VKAERPPAGEWPRPFTRIELRHIVEGEDVDETALARSIELSETKYCSVLATLRLSPEVSSTWQVN
jgi:putative redox protein